MKPAIDVLLSPEDLIEALRNDVFDGLSAQTT